MRSCEVNTCQSPQVGWKVRVLGLVIDLPVVVKHIWTVMLSNSWGINMDQVSFCLITYKVVPPVNNLCWFLKPMKTSSIYLPWPQMMLFGYVKLKPTERDSELRHHLVPNHFKGCGCRRCSPDSLRELLSKAQIYWCEQAAAWHRWCEECQKLGL